MIRKSSAVLSHPEDVQLDLFVSGETFLGPCVTFCAANDCGAKRVYSLPYSFRRAGGIGPDWYALDRRGGSCLQPWFVARPIAEA